MLVKFFRMRVYLHAGLMNCERLSELAPSTKILHRENLALAKQYTLHESLSHSVPRPSLSPPGCVFQWPVVRSINGYAAVWTLPVQNCYRSLKSYCVNYTI